MNIKLSSCLVAISTILYGCATTPENDQPTQPPMQNVPVVDTVPIDNSSSGSVVNPDKTNSDGSHLKNLPMSRDFIMDSPDNFQAIDTSFQAIGSKGNKKIFSIKPTGKTKPRAVILLENKMIGSSVWNFRDYDLQVRRKNVEICRGFMSLQTVDAMVEEGIQTGDVLKFDRNNHVITFMPAKGSNKNNLPINPDGCDTFLSNGYDFASSSEELSFILQGKKLGKSPYLAVYESPNSLYSSMILSLGELSPNAITVLASNWSELITKVYRHGDSIDPTIGIAIMLSQDISLQEAQKEAKWGNMRIAVSGATCGGTLAASSITLNALLATPSCKKFVQDAAYAMGYKLRMPAFS